MIAGEPFDDVTIGVDIGGTKIAAGAVTPDDEIVARCHRPSPVDRLELEDAIVGVVTDIIGDLAQENGATGGRTVGPGQRVSAVGIGAAGWIDTRRDLIRFSPHLPWRDEPLAERLRDRLGLPVRVDNDANAAAWGEYRHRLHVDPDQALPTAFLCLTLGTGIGGGLVLGGELFRGAFGMAGEWGHMTVVPDGLVCACGHRGCWEQYCSGTALTRGAHALVAERAPGSERLKAESVAGTLDGPTVTRLAEDGDAACRVLLAETGQWLGRGLASLAAILDPDLIVIGGGVSRAGELILAPARAAFAETLTGSGFRTPARIELAGLGSDAGLVGAAGLARNLR
ncbi:MAG: ROK family protein [Propionibacteriaceae bacterium]|nr:ROK family protein [Propionibacteriaceae bacterium]